ncbi:MAG: FAD-dependent oxidoreductase [Candidatus Jordarchaeaceae archaeon]
MIGVYICECGGNIGDVVDVNAVKEAIQKIPDVKTVRINRFLCSKLGLKMIVDSVKKQNLDRVVVASCSPHMHEETFRETVVEAGLNPYMFVHTNIREQDSWVTKDKKKATEKAIAIISGAVGRARKLEPLQKTRVEISKDIMVIGGGIAGITAALQLANSGYHVIMVEKKPSIGGRMAQLSKVFPTLDCAPCILSPRMADVDKNPNITLLTSSEVERVSGGPGNYEVQVRVKPRGVDVEKCLRCGKCEKVCEVEVPDEYEAGLYKRKAIYLPFAQAVPAAYAIDFENCRKCGTCQKECPTEAININQEERVETFNVGAIIVTTGYDLLDKGEIERYKVDEESTITSLQLERLIENELAAGEVLKNSKGKRIKDVAFILCVGSRNPHKGVSYCSKVCCPYAVKEAILLKKTLPYLRIWIYYIDLRMAGRGYEELYRQAREMNINFIHGKPAEVSVDPESGRLQIVAEDIDTGQVIRNSLDLVVLCPAMIPSRDLGELASKLNISTGEDGFIAEKHIKLNPVSTLREGIYAAGTALGPKDIRESVVDARSTAAQAIEFLGEGYKDISPIKARLVGECRGAGECVKVCPHNAITLNEKTGKAEINILACNGCGACVPACPNKALQLAHYTKEQILEEVKGLLSVPTEDIRIIGFFGDSTAYPAADAAGVSRLNYPPNLLIVRVPSTALIDTDTLIKTLEMGADGIMLCENGDTREGELTEENVKKTQVELEKRGIEKERVFYQPLAIPAYKSLPYLVETYLSRIKKIGKIGVKTAPLSKG